MKKIFCAVLILMVITAVLGGCSGKSADLKAVMNDINTGLADTTDLKELTDVSELQSYYFIEPEDVKQFAAEIKTDSSAAPCEIVLVEAKDDAAAENIRTALERRYNSLVNQYASYSPAFLELVKGCGVSQNGTFVTMIIAENYDALIKTVNESLQSS